MPEISAEYWHFELSIGRRKFRFSSFLKANNLVGKYQKSYWNVFSFSNANHYVIDQCSMIEIVGNAKKTYNKCSYSVLERLFFFKSSEMSITLINTLHRFYQRIQYGLAFKRFFFQWFGFLFPFLEKKISVDVLKHTKIAFSDRWRRAFVKLIEKLYQNIRSCYTYCPRFVKWSKGKTCCLFIAALAHLHGKL